MTCKEKYRLEHPDTTEAECDKVFNEECPCDYGYADAPYPCFTEKCETCWDRDSEWRREENTEAAIKDSGDRTQFESGAVRDMHEGKGRMDLLPWSAIMEVSKHCENGANKYGEHNVDKGIPTSSLCDSAARHLAKYLEGWTDEPHLVAAAWNLLWAIQMEIKKPEVVNTPWRGDDKNA
jgi:hypothetical protein